MNNAQMNIYIEICSSHISRYNFLQILISGLEDSTSK